MLDVLSYAAVALALAVAGVLVYANTRPDTFRVARSAEIKAPPDRIFPLIDDLHAFNRWNPFLALDPATKITYRGPTAGAGAAHDWSGNSKVGQGSIEITESQPPSNIKMKLDMLKPMAAHNRVEFTLVPRGDMTEVTWAMTGPSNLMSKAMGMVFDMDKMVGAAFERGLAALKSIVEKP